MTEEDDEWKTAGPEPDEVPKTAKTLAKCCTCHFPYGTTLCEGCEECFGCKFHLWQEDVRVNGELVPQWLCRRCWLANDPYEDGATDSPVINFGGVGNGYTDPQPYWLSDDGDEVNVVEEYPVVHQSSVMSVGVLDVGVKNFQDGSFTFMMSLPLGWWAIQLILNLKDLYEILSFLYRKLFGRRTEKSGAGD